VGIYEDAAQAATAVVRDPGVVAAIRQAAGIEDPDVITIDTDYYTIDEIDMIEELIGDEFGKFMNLPGKKGKDLRILAFIMRRRTDPEFPFEKAGSLKISFKTAPVPPTSGNGLEQS